MREMTKRLQRYTNTMRDLVLFVIVFVAFISIVYYVLSVHVIPYSNGLIVKRLNDALIRDKITRYGMSDKQIKRMFDASTGAMRNVSTSGHRSTVRNNTNQTIEDPLITVDCRTKNRSCLRDQDCNVLCSRNATTLPYECDQKLLVCRETGININDPNGNDDDDDDNENNNSNGTPIKCNNEMGEYALLQGYNNLGVAEWNCVQLFPSWRDPGKRYCEGGVMHLDTRKSLPSYKQCECPNDTKRIVYKRSIGQTIFTTGLPHCVKNSKLFEVDNDYVVYDK